MKIFVSSTLAITALAAKNVNAAFPSEVTNMLDISINPCDDFYQYTCGGWMKNLALPDDRQAYAYSFTSVTERNEPVIQEISKEGWPLLGEFWDSCTNVDAITAKGTEHLQKDLARIAGVSNKTDLFKLSGDLSPIGHKFFFEARVNADMKNVSTNAFYIGPGSLVLPDKSIYLDNATFAADEPFYRKYISTILTLASNSSDNQPQPNNTSNTTEAEDAIINIEKSLATILPIGEEESIDNVYNPVKYSDATKEWPLIFGALADGIRLTELSPLNDTSNVIVTTPAYFDRAEKLVDTIDVKDLKIYLTFLYLNSCASYLGQPFLDAHFEFFEKTLSGSSAMPPRERTCTEAQITFFPVLVGEYYAQKMFDASREEYANLLVTSLESAMADHIAKLDWLDDETRAKAEEKLKMITNHIGRSTQKKNYPFTLTRNDYLLNVLTIKNSDWAESLQKIGQEVDRTEWILSGATVDAYYTPTLNQIIFPAAILQPPFYRNDSHPVQNFGAIGVLVGHEITHGFDSNGRLFDGEGNQVNWWTNETALEFASRAECMMKQYSSFTVTGSSGTPIGNVNGNLTISENIADNGGLGLAFDAYHAWAKSNGSFDSHGVADDEVDKLFFISLGQMWCASFRDSNAKQQLVVDVHSPPHWRVNGAAMNNDDFAKTFNCPVGSKMNPEKKCKLW